MRFPADPVVDLALQLVAAATGLVSQWGLAVLPVILILPICPSPAWWALGFLIIASTLVGYGVFLDVNNDVSALIAHTFNYASPVVALLLSAALTGGRTFVTEVVCRRGRAVRRGAHGPRFI